MGVQAWRPNSMALRHLATVHACSAYVSSLVTAEQRGFFFFFDCYNNSFSTCAYFPGSSQLLLLLGCVFEYLQFNSLSSEELRGYANQRSSSTRRQEKKRGAWISCMLGLDPNNSMSAPHTALHHAHVHSMSE